MKTTIPKIFVAVIGLCTMALGVAFSVKANLGVSPISCIPYVYSLKFDLSLGQLTILMNLLFILAQFLILRKRYTLLHLSQVASLIVFGFCIDLAMFLIGNLNVSNYIWQMMYCLLSCVLLAIGVFLLVKANLTYLPGDGFAVVVSDTFKKDFGKLKVTLDSSMVIIGLISSFAFLHRVEGIREGTVIAALLVGSLVKYLNRKITWLDAWLDTDTPESEDFASSSEGIAQFPIITIAREYGSGGHGIGKSIAQKLGIDFYDKELINITAKKSGFTEEYIQENEQKLARTLLDELYVQNYAYVKDELPPSDVLFLVQSKAIREVARRGPCVIVGRCANFILKDTPCMFNAFIHADEAFRKTKIVNEYGVDISISSKELEKLDRERADYCQEYTGEDWRDSTNYHITINSAQYGSEEEVADKIIELLPEHIRRRLNACGKRK